MPGLSSLGEFMQNDPHWIRGLANLAGQDPNQAYALAMQNQVEQAKLEELANSRETQKRLREIIASGQISPEMAQEVMRHDLDAGMKMLDYIRKNKAGENKSALLSKLVGGGGLDSGGIDPVKIATVGAIDNDPTMLSLATFMQNQQNRTEDLETKSGERTFKQEKELRKEFSDKSTNYDTIKAAFQKIEQTESDPSAAGDIALIYGFMKMNDPESVVREGEYATAENAGGVPDRVRVTYNKLVDGERLTPKMRADFLRQATGIYGSALKGQESLVGEYNNLAKSYGVDPERIVSNKIYKPKPKNANIPDGILPEEWDVMTDEERALWQ